MTIDLLTGRPIPAEARRRRRLAIITLTFAQTVFASALGGVVVGVLALAGVLITSRRAAMAAVAADARHADAENARWLREQRIAAYLELLVRLGAQAAQVRIVHTLFVHSPNAAGNAEAVEQFHESVGDATTAFDRVQMIASAAVVSAATRLIQALSQMAQIATAQTPAADADYDAAGADYRPAYKLFLDAVRQELRVPN